jgi:hypothetical protein
MSREVSARIALLDNQIVDGDEIPIGRVDDLELDVPERGAPRVVSILTGSQALGERIGGAVGRAIATVSTRLRDSSSARPTQIEANLIEDLEPLVKLRAPLRELPDVAALERWLAIHIVERLPGGGDADL